jgi:DNA-binding PadR family transcriptional regulator
MPLTIRAGYGSAGCPRHPDEELARLNLWLGWIYRQRIYSVAMVEVPLREPTFLILTALAAGPQHGYGVIEDVLRISHGQVRLHAGTLYTVLDRLRVAGLIEVEREEIVQSRLRRYYRLTGLGAQRLAEESARMRRHAETAARRLRKLGTAFGGAS